MEMNFKPLNAALYLVGWFFLVHSAARGFAWEGLLLAAVIVIVHLWSTEHKLSELTLIFFSIVAGFLIESFFIFCGVLSYASPNHLFPQLAPLWILGLYAIFAITINHSLAMIGNSFMMAAIFGFAGSICSYYVGYRMGAAEFLIPEAGSLLVIGSAWFFFLPLLYKVNRAIVKFRENHVH